MGIWLEFCHRAYTAISSGREGAQFAFSINTIDPERLNYNSSSKKGGTLCKCK